MQGLQYISYVQVIVCSDVQASIEFREAYRHSLHSYLENCGASINEDGADDIAIVHSIWILDCISSFSFLRVANKQYKL